MDKTTAIIARTNRALREPEQALVAANVPYYLVGRSGFWNAEEVKSVLSYVSASIFPADYTISGMLRSGFHPVKFLPKSKLQSRLKELKEADDSVTYWNLITQEPHTLVENRNLEALRNFASFVHSLSRHKSLPAGEAVKQILVALRAIDHYSEFEETPDNSPVENLADLVKIAGRHSTVKDFLDFTRRASAASKKRSGVALGTIHSVKGMEYHTVYVIQCSEGVLPHSKATDLAGESNAFFVAASRAERELVISYSGTPSIFLAPYLTPVIQSESKEETCDPALKLIS
jgi:DNA helicase-2/ATP-dependent DNA helicase PcrA